MDAQENLVWNSQLTCAVLVGKDGDRDVLNLVNVDEQVPFECQMTMARQGCRYIGVLAIKNGVMDGEPADHNPATIHALLSAVQPFATYAAEKLARPKDGLGDWLERLAALPDTREKR